MRDMTTLLKIKKIDKSNLKINKKYVTINFVNQFFKTWLHV